jgi:hypothetical protein
MSLFQSTARVDVHQLKLPRPIWIAAPWVALALISAGGAVAGLPPAICLGLAAGAVLVALVRMLLELRDLWALRRAADAVLRTGARVHPYSALLTWRAAQLTAESNRKVLARSLRNIVRDVEQPSLMSAVPLDRPRVREHAGLFGEIADRLAAVASPIRPHAVLLVEELVTDGARSPIYAGGDTRSDLGDVLRECLAALDPPTGSAKAGAFDVPFDSHLIVFDPTATAPGRRSAHGGGNR